MTKILLIRHGRVEGIKPARFRSRAEAVAKRIANHWQSLTIYASLMARCVRIAEAVVEVSGIAVRISQLKVKERPMSDDYDARSKQIVSMALAAWVGDLDETIGLGDAELDPCYQTKRRTVQDAVNATYHEGITDDEWLAATLRRMEGK